NPLVGNYVCADGATIVLMMLQSERFWPHFAATIGRPDLLERYPTPEARQQETTAIREELERHFATRPRAEWADILRASACPCAPRRASGARCRPRSICPTIRRSRPTATSSNPPPPTAPCASAPTPCSSAAIPPRSAAPPRK